MKADNYNGEGHEFDYFDEFPEDDPFMPKPTCHVCKGECSRLNQNGEWVSCYACNGTGVLDGR